MRRRDILRGLMGLGAVAAAVPAAIANTTINSEPGAFDIDISWPQPDLLAPSPDKNALPYGITRQQSHRDVNALETYAYWRQRQQIVCLDHERGSAVEWRTFFMGTELDYQDTPLIDLTHVLKQIQQDQYAYLEYLTSVIFTLEFFNRCKQCPELRYLERIGLDFDRLPEQPNPRRIASKPYTIDTVLTQSATLARLITDLAVPVGRGLINVLESGKGKPVLATNFQTYFKRTHYMFEGVAWLEVSGGNGR